MRPTHDIDLVKQIARLTFFYHGRSTWRPAQEVRTDLAKLGRRLSVEAVVACQRTAFDLGFVVMTYAHPDEQAEIERLELLMLDRFKADRLRRVILVPGDPRVLDDGLSKEEQKAIHRRVTILMAEAGAKHVAELLREAGARHPAERVYRFAVARGYTLYEFAKALRRLHLEDYPKLIKVLPTVAIGDVQRAHPVEANIIASEVATVLRGVSGQLACPAVVHHSQYDLFASNEQVKPVLHELTQSDLVVSGFGPIALADDASDVVLTTDSHRNKEWFRSAREAQVVGEVSCQWLSTDGDPVATDYRAIGLDIPTLKQIASGENGTGRTVMMIGGGDRRRIAVLEAAISGGLVNVVVTDTTTARVLLKELPM